MRIHSTYLHIELMEKIYQHRPQIAQANLCAITVEKGAAENGVTVTL